MGHVGVSALLKALGLVGGLGFKTNGPPKIFNTFHSTLNQYHGATWQPMTGPRGTSSFAIKVPHVNL